MKEKIVKLADELRVVDYKLISSYYEGYLGKEVYEVTLANGMKKKVERLVKSRNDGDAVVIIPITKEGKVIVLVQSRPNMIDSDGVAVEFPAGMVDSGEEYEAAARRELAEETGFVCSSLEELEWHYQDQGCSNAIIKTFIAKDCELKMSQELDPDEVLEPVEVTFDELIELYDTRVINDASSKLAILTYLRKYKKDF